MGKRINRLEACRGMAAMVVVFSHTLLAFEPSIVGETLDQRTSYSLSGTIFYTFFNGTGAVVFFFVLSGYVLSIKCFQSPHPELIACAVFKRLPRLAGITTVVTVLSALIWLSGLYYYWPAAELTGSLWLGKFGGANLPNDFVPTIAGAIAQGSWRTFFTGESYLDMSLWTMRHELHGSFLVFLSAPFFIYVLRRKVVWLLLLIGIVIFRYSDIYMIPFLCGLGISYYDPLVKVRHSPWYTVVLLVGGLYLLGFAFPDRHYTVFVIWGGLLNVVPEIAILSIGATAVIVAILRSPTAEKILGGKFGAMMGRLSFPIYLVHVPVICSAASLTYVTMFPSLGRAASYPAALCTITITLVIALPLAKLDVSWVRFLNARLTVPRSLAPLPTE
jgi:peptidoglycan/LPS O-acetylase OafA/YrhL